LTFTQLDSAQAGSGRAQDAQDAQALLRHTQALIRCAHPQLKLK